MIKKSASCSICNKDFAYLNRSTTNLLRHVRVNHTTEYSAANGAVVVSSTKKVKPTAEESTPQIDEALAKITKYKRDSIEKKQIDDLVLGLITKDIQPLSVVENEGFRDLVHRLDRRYEIVSRSHLTEVLLPEKYKTEKEKLIKELEEVDHVATTTDHWTSRANESYATMTAHYITADWELKSPVLFTRSEGRRQTAENLAEELTATFAEFGIQNKVRACVTDNAPNATKSVTLTDADHHNCFAHTLNLAAAGGISKDVPTKDIVKKVKAIVKFFHCSAVANRALKDTHTQNNTNFRKLQQEVETRWNSTYLMLQSYVVQHNQVTTVLCLRGKNDMCLSTHELGVAKQALETLEPLYLATVELSTEKMTSLSKIIPMVKQLHAKLAKDTSSLGMQLKTCLNARFSSIEDKPLLSMATLLDPRFKEKGFSNPKKAETAVLQLIKEAEKIQIQETDDCQPIVEQTVGSNGFWEDFYDEEDVEEQIITSTAEREVQTFMNIKKVKNCNPLSWWKVQEKNLPRLAKLCKEIMCIPATSVPSERVFSKAGELVSAKRTSLKACNVDMIIFLNKLNPGKRIKPSKSH